MLTVIEFPAFDRSDLQLLPDNTQVSGIRLRGPWLGEGRRVGNPRGSDGPGTLERAGGVIGP